MGYAAIIVACITVAGQVFTAVLVILLKRFVSPPSGDTLGNVVERTHHQSAVTTAGVKALIEHQGCGELPPELKPDRMEP